MDHEGRLRAMTAGDGQWDLSPKDVAAIGWALGRSSVADSLKDALDAAMCALIGWDDNGLQQAHARRLSAEAIRQYNLTGEDLDPANPPGVPRRDGGTSRPEMEGSSTRYESLRAEFERHSWAAQVLYMEVFRLASEATGEAVPGGFSPLDAVRMIFDELQKNKRA